MLRRPSFVNNLVLLFLISTLQLFQGVAQAETPRVTAALSFDTGSSGPLFRGWPLVVSIEVRHSQGALARFTGDKITPITITTTARSWAHLVKLVVRNDKGVVQGWPFQLVTTPGNSLVLDASHSGRLMVTLAPSATAAINPGKYKLRLWFDTRKATTEASWKGWATDEVELVISEVPTSLTPEQRCDKGHMFAGYHVAQGNSAQALAALDSALTEAPEEVLCLSARAEFAVSMGKTYEAIDFYKRAILAQRALPSTEPRGDGVPGIECRALTNSLPPGERDPLVECGYRRSTP